MAEIKTQGTVLERETDTTDVYEEVTGILDFSGPTPSRNEIDTTDLSSTAKTFKLGLIDNGEMTFNGKFAPSVSVHQAVISDLDADAPRNWRVVLSDGSTVSFSAYVKGMPITGSADEIVKYSLTLRISGDITWSFVG